MDLDEIPDHIPENKGKISNTLRNALILYSATVVMVLARSIDFVLFIRMAKKMTNYEYILADVLLPVGFMCVAWPVVWYKMFISGGITKEMRAFPNYKFILMGVFDSLGVLLATIPASFVSGPVNVVMTQSVIIINVIASFIFLHFRYSPFHIAGVSLVSAGIVVDIWPMFASESGSSSSGDYTWMWILLLLLANVPMAASNVYKEKYLKEADLDVWYMNAWVAFYQFVFGLLCFPMTFIPLPAPATYISPKELPNYFVNSMKCFIGIDSIVSGPSPDKCSYFWLVFLVFIMFNMTYNILMLVVFQRGSSTLAVIASAARLALSNVGFLVKPLAGEAYQHKLSFFDIIALSILILGIVIYSSKPENVASDEDLLKRIVVSIGNKFDMIWYKIFFCCRNEEEQDSTLIYLSVGESVNNLNQQRYISTTNTKKGY
jgi:drug/metabolite transporter (DMT)-like permease